MMKSGLLPTKTKTAFLCAALLAALSTLLVLPNEAKAQSLSVNNIFHNRVDLTVSGHTGNWWYSYTPGGGCTSAGNVGSVTAEPLSADTPYTFTAWSNSTCLNRIGSAQSARTKVAPSITVSAVKNDSATLTINDWTGNWWYKRDSTNASCEAGPSNGTVNITGLDANTSYTYKAWENSVCRVPTNGRPALASKTFKTRNPALTATEVTGSGAKLTLKNGTGAWGDAWWYDGNQGLSCTKVPAGTATVSLGLKYYLDYVIWAYDESGCTVARKQADVRFSTPYQTTYPPALSNFTVSTGPKNGEVTLRWDSAESHWNVSSYRVWLIRKGQKGGRGTEKNLANDKNSYVFSNLDHGVEYTGRVQYITKPIYASLSDSEVAVAHGRAKAPSPGQVTGVTLTPGPTENSLTAKWTAVSTAYAYDVQIKASNPSYLNAKRLEGKDNTSWTVSGFPANQIGVTHTVNVKAKRHGTSDGPWSDDVYGVPKYFAPAKVTGVSVAKGTNAGNLDVSWSSVSNATSYKVQWKSGTESFSDTRQNSVTATSSTITGLTGGVEHTVRVRAVRTNARADGPNSDEVKQTPYAPTPGQVTGVSVSAPSRGASGLGKLDVSWNAITGATGFDIQWKKSGVSWSEKSISVADATGTTITGLDNGATYTVRVRATNEHAKNTDGQWSSEETATTNAGPPVKVTGVSVNPGVGTLAVSWSSVNDVTGYKVQWKSGNQNFDSGRQNTETGTSSTITGLTGGVTHAVRVIAYNADGDGVASQSETGIPKHQKPAKVTGVTVAEQAEQLQVRWSTVTNATGYKVRWQPAGQSNWSEKTVSGGTSSQTIISPLTAGTTYSVQVRATRTHADDGDWSDTQTGSPEALKPGQVANVRVTDGSALSGSNWSPELDVTWDPVTGASGYVVEWKTTSGNAQTTDLGIVISHTINTGLTAGTEYTVRVKAKRTNAEDGDWSAPATARTKKQPPDHVTSLEITPGVEQLAVSWTAPTTVPAPEHYRVEWKSGSQNFTQDPAEKRHKIVAATETSYTIQGLVAGTAHTVRVIATIQYADDPNLSTAPVGVAIPQSPPPPTAPGTAAPPGGSGTPGGGGDNVICPDYPTSETAADVERERDSDTLVDFVQDARFGVESILGEETEESAAIDRLVKCFGVDGDWMSGSIYLFAITDGRKYFLAPRDSGLAGTHLNLMDDNGCDVAAEIIRAARGEQLQCEDIGLLPEGDAEGFLQYLWDNPADTSDDSEPGYENRGDAPGNSPKLSYVEGITDEELLPGGLIILGAGYYPNWDPPAGTDGGGGGGGAGGGGGTGGSGGDGGGVGCAVAGTGSTLGSMVLNLILAAGFLAAFAASRKKFRRTGY